MTEGSDGHDKGTEQACQKACRIQGFSHAGPHDSVHVIPDVFNRESMAFPMQGHTNEGTEEKNSGFPLKTGGNDRGGRREGQRGADGKDRGG